MSTQQISSVQEQTTSANTVSQRLTRHDVTFQLRVVSYNGEPVNDDTPHNRAMMEADDKLEKALGQAVSNWHYRDHDGIEGTRLEIFQPEFGYDDDQPDNVTLYDVSVYSGRELPKTRAEATEELPLSIQQLVEEAVPAIVSLYGSVGVQMELHRVRFSKQYESVTSGDYAIK